MSKVKGILSNIRGSIGEVTFFRNNNETIAYEKADHKDARYKNIVQRRTCWANIVRTYHVIKSWLLCAFEDKKTGQSDYNMFLSANLAEGSTAVYLTKEEVRANASVAAPYIISNGSLDSIGIEYSDGIYVSNLSLGSLTITAETTIADFTLAVLANNDNATDTTDAGIRIADQITFYWLVQKQKDGVPYTVRREDHVSLNANDQRLLWNVVYPSAFASHNGVLATSADMPDGAYAWVRSRKVNSGTTLVSSERLACHNSILADYTDDDAFERAATSYGGYKTSLLKPDGDSGSSGYEPTPETRYTQTVSVAEGMEAMGSVSGGGSYAEGTEITIHAVANSGYEFLGWVQNENPGYVSTDADYTLEVEQDNDFKAEFQAEAAQVTLTVGQDTNPNWGDIQIDDRTAAKTDTITVAAGTEVTIKAIAATGYSFSSWTDGNTSATRTITVTENKTVNASFESR